MNLAARFGIVVLLTLSSMSATAESGKSNLEEIGQALLPFAQVLHDSGQILGKVAGERRELTVIADAALKLALEIEEQEKKGRHGTLTQQDLKNLSIRADALAQLIKQLQFDYSGQIGKQLSTILDSATDVKSIGVGGSDLGAS